MSRTGNTPVRRLLSARSFMHRAGVVYAAASFAADGALADYLACDAHGDLLRRDRADGRADGRMHGFDGLLRDPGGTNVILSDIPGCSIGALDHVYLQLLEKEPEEFARILFTCIVAPSGSPAATAPPVSSSTPVPPPIRRRWPALSMKPSQAEKRFDLKSRTFFCRKLRHDGRGQGKWRHSEAGLIVSPLSPRPRRRNRR